MRSTHQWALAGVSLVLFGISGCSQQPSAPPPGPAGTNPTPPGPTSAEGPKSAASYPVAWSAMADPAVVSGEVSATYPIQIEAGTETTFPRAWPPLAYKYQGKRAEVVNLRTGNSVGAVQDPEPLPNRPAVSADGKKMATRLLKEGNHIRIWSFESGRLFGDRVLADSDPRFGPVTMLHFASADRLVGIRPGTGGGQVVVMDLAQATPPRMFTLASPQPHATLLSNAVGTSPGGKYLAALVGRALVIHDLESGNCVGTSELPADVPEGSLDGKEIVFSPDGKQLATLLTSPGSAPMHLLEWDATSGKVSQHKQWSSEKWVRESNYVTAHDEHPLTYLPDGSAWVLYGRLMWKREAAAPETAFAGSDDTQPRCLLDSHRVVAKTQDQGKTVLQVVSRPGTELASTPATPTTPKVAQGWQVKPDPAALIPRVAAEPMAVFGNLPQAARFSQRPGVHAACSIGQEYIVFDLESGTEAKRFTPSTGKVLPIRDVSPDGRFLIAAANRSEAVWKFEVWNVATGKLALQGEEHTSAGQETIEFLSSGKLLLTHNVEDTGQRRFAVWDLNKQQRTQEFTTPLPPPGGFLSGSHLVSPGGRYVISGFQEALLVHDLGSGELLGKVALPQGTGRTLPQDVLAAATTLDGNQLHLVVRYQPEVAQLITCDMTSGKLSLRELDGKSLASVQGQRLYLRPTPWLPDQGHWLVCGQAAVNSSTGEIIAPLGLQVESALLPLPENKFLLGHTETGLEPSPAAALTPIEIKAQAAAQLANGVEKLRPKVAVVEPPMPKPSTTASNTAEPTAEPAPELSPKRKWSSKVDPADDLKPLIPAKQFAVPIERNPSFFASERGGSFLLVTDEDGETAQVVDLAAGKGVGEQFPLPRQVDTAAIDPTGRYVAFASTDNEITIRNVASGKSLVVQRPGTFVNCHYLGFAKESHVVAAFEADDRTEVRVWKPEGGEPVKKFTLSAGRDDWGVRNTGLAISPGGRFLAALRHDGLTLYDLQGSDDEESTVVPFANRKAQIITFKCDGICFSPDGKKLAATYLQGQFDNVTIWDMETGDPLVFRPSQRANHLRTITHSDYGPTLCWFPDGESLLYTGSMLLDGLTGCPYWVLDQDERYTVLPLTAKSVLEIEQAEKRRLVATSIPKGVPAASEAVRKSPAEFTPPLNPIDTRPGSAAPHVVAGPPILDAQMEELAKGPIQLSADKPDIRPNRLAISSTGVLAIEQIVNYIESSRPVITKGPLTPEREVILETYEAASGKRLHQLEVPERANLLDISPDGSLLLTGDELYGSGGYSRLDVWAPKLGKHAAGWQPLPYETDFFDVVTWAGFIDRKHVLVLGGQQLICWQLPECRQVYTVATDAQPRFSANRKQFLERKTGLIRNGLSGAAVGKLEGVPGDRHFSLLDAGFSPDGVSITGVTSNGMSHSVVQWDVATGKITNEFAIPPAQHMSLALVGDRGVLLLNHSYVSNHGGLLIDLKQQQVVSLHSANGVHARGPGASFWRTDFALVDNKGAYFAKGYDAADFSWPELASPPAYAVLRPGSKVAIDFQSGLPEAAKLKTMFEEKVKAAGYVIDPSAATKAVFRANQDRTIVQKTPVEVAIPVIVCHIALLDASGGVAWEAQDRQRHDDSVKFDVIKWLEPRGLPRSLFKPDWQKQIKTGDFPPVKS